jgi:pyrimidine-nucleoside phosphorylase
MAALITDMDTPLGFAVGNSLEVIEAFEVLSGRGPSDLRSVSLEIAARLLSLSQGVELEEARNKAKDALDAGKALEKFVEWIAAQGGEEKYARDPALLGVGKEIRQVYAPCDGYVFSTDTEKIGLASLALGAGRRTKSDRIDQAAGILLGKKRGDRVERGEPIATLYASDAALLDEGERLLSESYTYSDLKPEIREIIHKVIS